MGKFEKSGKKIFQNDKNNSFVLDQLMEYLGGQVICEAKYNKSVYFLQGQISLLTNGILHDDYDGSTSSNIIHHHFAQLFEDEPIKLNVNLNQIGK